MSASVAPIAPAHGSFPELVADGVDGMLYKPNSPEALAEVLVDVDRDPARFVAIGRSGRDTYERRFTREANVERLLAIYDFAMRNPIGAA